MSFDYDELSAAFDKVKPSEDWKNPIHTKVHVGLGIRRADNIELLTQAIIYFTGCVPTISALPDWEELVLVEAAGYYMTMVN